jgi:uncharacterized damage-inducible protein DinB
MNEIQRFTEAWEAATKGTLALFRALPPDQYDFRPDAGGRSLGELAWHLAEVDGYVSLGIERGEFTLGVKPPHIERPRTVEALPAAFQKVHDDAVARVNRLQPDDLDREIRFFDGELHTIRDVLWNAILLHSVHHRGQLSLLCRLANGVVPPLFGPAREQSAAVRARAAAV